MVHIYKIICRFMLEEEFHEERENLTGKVKRKRFDYENRNGDLYCGIISGSSLYF